MFELRNAKTVNLKLRRGEVCDLLLALGYTSDGANADKWDKLHDKIKLILQEWDEEYDKKHKE